MKTYEDLLDVIENNDQKDVINFVKSAIAEHKGSTMYREAKTAYEYFCRRNETILKFQKLLYTLLEYFL